MVHTFDSRHLESMTVSFSGFAEANWDMCNVAGKFLYCTVFAKICEGRGMCTLSPCLYMTTSTYSYRLLRESIVNMMKW